MTLPAPPGPVSPPAVYDINHPTVQAAPAAAPAAPFVVPVAPGAVAVHDVNHPVAAAEAYGPVTESEPRPLPEPLATSRTPLTVAAPTVAEKVTMIGDIAPEEALFKPEPAAKPAVVRTATVPASAPVQAVEVPAGSEIAGGQVAAPVVTMPVGAPTRAVETPYAVADSVRKFAASNGVDLSQVVPAGKGGRITKKDVEAAIAVTAAASTPATPPVQIPVEPAELDVEPAQAPVAVAAAASAPPAESPAAPVPMVAVTAPERGAVGSDHAAHGAPGANGPTAPVEPAPVDPAASVAPTQKNQTAPVQIAAPAPAPSVSMTTAVVRWPFIHGGGQQRTGASAMDFVRNSPEKAGNLNVIDAAFEFAADGSIFVVATVDTTMAVAL